MILKGSMGLGDAIYLYPVVKYYSNKLNGDVTIITRYPEIYSGLNCKAIKEDEFIDCSVSARTKEDDTNIYEDILLLSGIYENLPFLYDFKPKYKFNTDKKVCVIRNLSYPVKGDESASVMVPNIEVYQDIVDTFKDDLYFVTIGWKVKVDEKLEGIDLDLSETKDLQEYISVLNGADIVITQPVHCVPIAEAFNKKLFCIFAKAGLDSMEKRYRFTTPNKILTKPTSSYCVDNELDFLYNFKKLLEM